MLTSYDNNFNFLRLTAAVLVVISHGYMVTGNYHIEPLRIITSNSIIFSTIGLYIFFFTSGFLVTKSARESAGALHFLYKRFLRIYPLLIIVVLISVFIAGPLLTRLSLHDFFGEKDSWKYLWTMSGLRMRIHLPGVFDSKGYANDLFNIPLWSIALEIKLYFSLAVLIAAKLIKSEKYVSRILISVILLCSVLLLLSHQIDASNVTLDYKQITLIIAFCIGSLFQTTNLSRRTILMLFGASLLLFSLRIATTSFHYFQLDEILLFSTSAYLIAFSHRFRITITKDLSYGIYIFTYPIQQLFFKLTHFNSEAIINILLSLTTSSILALLSWKYIEKPSLNLKQYYPQLSKTFGKR